MPKKLRTISEPALTDAVEFNIQELVTLWGHALGAKFYHEAEASWFTTNYTPLERQLGNQNSFYS